MTKKIFFTQLLLLLTTALFAQFTNNTITQEVSPKNDIVAISFDEQEQLWVGTSYGIYKKENDTWKTIGQDNMFIRDLHITPTGEVWAGRLNGGVLKLNNDQWEKSAEATAQSNSANAILTDQSGRTWFATWNKGLTMFDGEKWHNIDNKNSELLDKTILSLTVDKNNNLWVGTYRGLSCFDGNKWINFTRDNSQLPNNDIYALCPAKKNKVWVGTCGGLALVTTNGIEKTYSFANSGLPSNTILTLVEDHKNNLWIGTNKGLTKFDGKKWKTYTMENSNLLENRVQTLVVKDKKLYVGTSLGLSILDL